MTNTFTYFAFISIYVGLAGGSVVKNLFDNAGDRV